MTIRIPKKIKEAIENRVVERLLRHKGLLDTEPQLGKVTGFFVDVFIDRRSKLMSRVMNDVDRAVKILNSRRDISLKCEGTIIIPTEKFIALDFMDTYEDYLLASFVDEEVGVWILEHLVNKKYF